MPLAVDPLYAFYAFAAVAAVLAIEAVYLLFHDKKSYRSRVNRRLEMSGRETDREKVLVQLRRERGLADDGGYAMSLTWLNRLVLQSGIRVAPARLAAALAGIGLLAFAGLFYARGNLLEAGLGAAVAVAVVPLAALLVMRKRRRAKFGAQLPDAIDVIVRSLRAGHPVPTAIAMVAREMPDPIGSEFGMVGDEVTYGADLETALRSMMHRIGQEDLPLFVTSVAIQASTGGNLSQILDNLSKVIRERFKMRRKIRGLSAEGRSGAMILNATPFIVFVLVNGVNPSFYGDIIGLPSTKMVLAGALAWMGIGNLVMRRMINFRI